MTEAVAPAPSEQPARSAHVPPAGRAQASLLIVATCMSVLGAVLISPVQPQMVAAFAGTAGVVALVPIAVTVPGLMIGLFSPLAGWLADRVGRVRLLTVALVLYAVFGTAPLWLPTLPLIIASRVGVGLAEAVIMTCAITLLADLWTGAERDRLFGLDTVATAVAAVVFVALGGLAGSAGWRAPFWIYTVSLVLAVLAPRLLRDPAGLRRGAGDLPKLDWRPLVAPVGMALLGGVVIFAPIIELAYKLDSIGVTATAVIGLFSAAAAVGSATGAASYGWVSGRGTPVLLLCAFAIAGVGLIVLGAGTTTAVVATGAIVCSIGCGLLKPTLLVWAIAPLDLGQRGRATGIWTSAQVIGQFLCPLLVLALSAVLGGLTAALVALGVGSLLLAYPASRLARH